MKLFLVRHGETIENRKGINQGHLPGHLSKEGKEQANKIALRLKDEKFDIIYSSDLARAANTAKKIAKYHRSTPLVFTQELRELYAGSAAGKTKEEINRLKPKDMETFVQLRKRAKKFFEKIHKIHRSDRILIVGHGGTNRAIMTVVMKKPFSYYKKLGKMHNTALSVFEIDGDRNYKIKVLNCAKHLGIKKQNVRK
jgi:broad specificity phosphatase PhoE